MTNKILEINLTLSFKISWPKWRSYYPRGLGPHIFCYCFEKQEQTDVRTAPTVKFNCGKQKEEVVHACEEGDQGSPWGPWAPTASDRPGRRLLDEVALSWHLGTWAQWCLAPHLPHCRTSALFSFPAVLRAPKDDATQSRSGRASPASWSVETSLPTSDDRPAPHPPAWPRSPCPCVEGPAFLSGPWPCSVLNVAFPLVTACLSPSWSHRCPQGDGDGLDSGVRNHSPARAPFLSFPGPIA